MCANRTSVNLKVIFFIVTFYYWNLLLELEYESQIERIGFKRIKLMRLCFKYFK